MRFLIDIERRRDPKDKPYIQSFIYETEDRGHTVATALTWLNSIRDLKDTEGNSAEPIEWDRNCLQKKCGACAMVINGKPGLACDKRLFDLGARITLSPLKKFPKVRDLLVDRSIMEKNLVKMRVWMEGNASHYESVKDITYDASRCLQCGCCLEICPNFYDEGDFTGMAAAVGASRVLMEMGREEGREAYRTYERSFYKGCGKSLACRNICPAKIDIDRTLSGSNAVAVWKRHIKK